MNIFNVELNFDFLKNIVKWVLNKIPFEIKRKDQNEKILLQIEQSIKYFGCFSLDYKVTNREIFDKLGFGEKLFRCKNEDYIEWFGDNVYIEKEDLENIKKLYENK